MQEVCLKLSNQAHAGKVRVDNGSALDAYMRALAANTASDYFRARNAQRRDAGRTMSLENPAIQQTLADPLGGAAAIERRVLLRQIEQLSAAGDPRDLYVFRLFHWQGLTAKEIAQIPAVQLTEKGVESLIRRMKKRFEGGGEGIAAGAPS